ncbi:SDR family oxidoreductase [Luteimonas sp. A277]
MQTILVTGANRGIGLALVQRYRERGDQVIAVCRTSSAALEATGARIEAGVDVSDDAAVAGLAERLKGESLDVVVLNAGILTRQSYGEIDAAGFQAMRDQFEINALGPLRVLQALDANLARGSKVGIITSRMGSMGDNSSGGRYGYRASKAAVNAIGRSLAVDLEERGIAVQLLHPGFVATEMVGGRGEVAPEHAAAQLVERLDELDLEASGTFRHANGSQLPW